MRWMDSVIKATKMNLTQLWEAMEEGLAYSGPWGHKELDMTKRLNDDDDRRDHPGLSTADGMLGAALL